MPQGAPLGSVLQASQRVGRWVQHKAAPQLHRTSEAVIQALTREQGRSQWTALTPSRRWSGVIIWTLVSVAGFGLVWASFARIDETVQAMGKLEPKGSTLDVKAPMGGVIKDILAKEGDVVEKDQVLIEMDPTAARARLDALVEVRERTLADIQLSRGQLGGEVNRDLLSDNQRLRLDALQSEFRSRIDASQNSLDQAKHQLESTKQQLLAKGKALAIREKILADIVPLAQQGAMARSQFLKELQEVELLRGEVKSLTSNKRRAEEAVQESLNKLRNTKSLSLIDFSTKVEESEKQLAQLNNQISETELTLRYQYLRSPAHGVVFDLQPSAPGYVVNNEIPVLKIVPTDSLVARIYISNREIGFINPGQPVKIRVDAYPYNEFGELSGRIQSIGSDALEPDENFNYYRFPVTVSLDSSTLDRGNRKLPLLTGMSINANIILRQRPIIAIFTERILPFWDSLEQL